MSIDGDFMKEVDSRDMSSIYIGLANSIGIDPTLKQLDEMLNFAKTKIGESVLFKKHDGETLLQNQSDWTEEYYQKQIYALKNNFSRERLALCRSMVKYLLADTIKYRENEQRASQNGQYSKKVVGTVIGVSGAAVDVIAGGMIIKALAAGTAVSVGSVVTVALGSVAVIAGVIMVNSRK